MDLAPKKVDYREILWNFIGIAWRRKFSVLVPWVLGIGVSVGLFFVLPRAYRSATLILVEGQKVPESVVQSAVTGSAQGRLSTIKQQLLSRSFLTRIIGKFALYQNEDPEKEMIQEEKIALIRKNIEVRTKGRKRLESFSISFTGRDPETVMNVTNELASLILEENLKIREQAVEGAIEFLNSELDNKKALLEHREKELSEYKSRYLGELPKQLDANLRALDRLQLALGTVQLAQSRAKDRIVDLERTLKVTKQNLEVVMRGAGPSDLPFTLPSTLGARLNRKKQALSSLLFEYNEDYPDVAILRREIEAMEAQLALPGKSKKRVPLPSDERSEEASFEDAEPVIVLKRQIKLARRELKTLEVRETETIKQIKGYEKRVENTPRREQELIVLQRDYDNISDIYQTLLAKRLNAQVSRNLEKRQKGEQFRVIDPANFPIKPVKPNINILFLLGIVGGLGSGIALAYVKEQLDNTIWKSEEVERITSSLILAEIPDFDFERQHTEKKHKRNKVVDIEKFSGRTRPLRRGGAKN